MGMLDGARQRDLPRHYARQPADVGKFLETVTRDKQRDGAAVGKAPIWYDGYVPRGRIYGVDGRNDQKCLRDTVYSPDEYAADWEDVD